MAQGYTLDRANAALEFAGIKGAVLAAAMVDFGRRVSILALAVEGLEAHYGIEPCGPVGLRLAAIEAHQEAINER